MPQLEWPASLLQSEKSDRVVLEEKRQIIQADLALVVREKYPQMRARADRDQAVVEKELAVAEKELTVAEKELAVAEYGQAV